MENKAAVFILLGQSNAVGHGVPMKDEDKITTPLKNVFGLSREKNQSFKNTSLKWEGYKSAGMNLAEEQDDTYSVANLLAKHWQSSIDAGNELPDLHIIQIAIGAQGATKGYMWHPEYERVLVPGKLGTVKIALTPYTEHILSLVPQSLEALGKTPEYIGIHWRGSEDDANARWDELKDNCKNTLFEIFSRFQNALKKKVPVILHRRVSEDRSLDFDPSGEGLKKLRYINEIFEKLVEENKEYEMFDVRECPLYIPNVRGNGVFIEDVVHYTPEANMWVAQKIMDDYINNQLSKNI